jgi:hypothetical protein
MKRTTRTITCGFIQLVRRLQRVFFYDYQKSRENRHPQRFLENFTGFLQADGYADLTPEERYEKRLEEVKSILKMADSVARTIWPRELSNPLFSGERTSCLQNLQKALPPVAYAIA